MQKNVFIIASGVCIWFCHAVAGATLYVDDSVSSSGNGASWETAFKTIQEGIAAASPGDTVIVAEGTYVENIEFKGKNIVLTSTDPLNPTVVAATIIDGKQSGSVVTFSGTEDETCVLWGFTIQNGLAEHGGGLCGGTYYDRTHAKIQYNVIRDNRARQAGGGLYWCDGTVRNNIITGNSAVESGGGLNWCGGLIVNNTIANNSAPRGAGLGTCTGPIRNCIIWGNAGFPQVSSSSAPTYSCIEGWAAGGEGNIPFKPYFRYTDDGPFRLATWSPCIDAGDPASLFSNEPEPNGGRINIGAYGNTAEATYKCPDADADGLPDDWELHWFGGLEEDGPHDGDADGIRNVTEYRYGRDPTSADEAPIENLTKNNRYPTIQTALSDSDNGDQIVVHPGVYKENISFGGKNVVLSSIDPSSADIVASTILDGSRRGSVVSFSGNEGPDCVLSGFTVRNGESWRGGGIHGGSAENHTHATIQNNKICNNVAQYGGGGGLAWCDGAIRNNTIVGNIADVTSGGGGGLHDCDGIIQNNRISGNWAMTSTWTTTSRNYGGGLHRCDGTIINNTICWNSADDGGGGIIHCSGAIGNCIIWGNEASACPQLCATTTPAYSCIQDWTRGGEGNISDDPQFVQGGGDRLEGASPCIDVGKNEECMWGWADLDGNPRIWRGKDSWTVDMGAYEYGSFEFRVVGLVEPSEGETGLTWNSRPGDSYTVWSCLGLPCGLWNEETTIPSGGETTTWTDPGAASTLKFYRIEMKQ